MSNPITNEEAQNLIETAMPDTKAIVNGDGYKYEAIVVSSEFEGLNTVKRHKLVYAALDNVIKGGTLHALTIKAKTPAEYQG